MSKVIPPLQYLNSYDLESKYTIKRTTHRHRTALEMLWIHQLTEITIEYFSEKRNISFDLYCKRDPNRKELKQLRNVELKEIEKRVKKYAKARKEDPSLPQVYEFEIPNLNKWVDIYNEHRYWLEYKGHYYGQFRYSIPEKITETPDE